MYDFLSAEWVEAARALRSEYADQVPELPVEVRINLVVTDSPVADGDVHAYIDTADGGLALELGELDEADVTVTTEHEVARALLVGGDPQLLMQAFLEGRLRVQGDMTRLIALQGAVAQRADVDAAEELAAKIQQITA